MKYTCLALGALLLAGCKGMPGSVSLHNGTDTTSYALGMSFARRFKADSLSINPQAFVQGIQDGLNDSSRKMLTDQEMSAALSALDQAINMKRMAGNSAVALRNKKAGEMFLDQNKRRQGVITLPSGLQYEVVKNGTGPIPRKGQTVETRYRGTLIDGTEFDSSEKHGGTVRFTVDQVIPGWTEALLKMKVGSKWKLYIPSELAYGERGAGGMIGPNAALVFDIELVAVH